MNTVLAFALITILSAGQAQSALDAARELYANAAFEEALTALAKLPADTPAADARVADEYRLFTLFALGRTGEAEVAAETLIRRDPMGRLQSPDASPRIQGMFAAVRARVLPAVIRDKYRAGRTAIEQKDFASAGREFADTQQLIAEATSAGVTDPGLADLRVLVDGFLVLAKSQPAPPATAPAAAAPRSTAATATAPPVAEPVTTPVRAAEGPRVYGVEDVDVAPPIIVSQDMPEVPVSLRDAVTRSPRPMIVSVTIDERGRVTASDILIPMNPVYDRLVLAASKNWQYRPATRGGKPVAYQRVISIAVK